MTKKMIQTLKLLIIWHVCTIIYIMHVIIQICINIDSLNLKFKYICIYNKYIHEYVNYVFKCLPLRNGIRPNRMGWVVLNHLQWGTKSSLFNLREGRRLQG